MKPRGLNHLRVFSDKKLEGVELLLAELPKRMIPGTRLEMVFN